MKVSLTHLPSLLREMQLYRVLRLFFIPQIQHRSLDYDALGVIVSDNLYDSVIFGTTTTYLSRKLY